MRISKRGEGVLGYIAVPRICRGDGMGTKRTSINVLIGAWCIGECTNFIYLGRVDPRVGVDCLPYGKQSIHVPVHVTFLIFRWTDSCW